MPRRRLDRARSGLPDRRARPPGGRRHPAAADRRRRRAGIPAIGISNFTWDWIYEDYDARRLAPGLVETIDAHYACGRRGLAAADARRLRHHRDAADLPLVARVGRQPRDVVRAALGLPADRPLVWCRSAATAPAASTCTAPPPRCAAWPTSSRRSYDTFARRRRPPHRRNGDVRAAHPLRGPGRRGRRRRQQAGLRDHLGLRRERHGAALHGPRPLLRVRRAGAGDAALSWRRRSSARRTCWLDAGATRLRSFWRVRRGPRRRPMGRRRQPTGCPRSWTLRAR